MALTPRKDAMHVITRLYLLDVGIRFSAWGCNDLCI